MSLIPLLLIILLSPAFGLEDAEWSMYRGGPSRLGVAPSGPLTNETLWSTYLHGFALSSPAVADGAIFIGTGSGIIYCFDEATGGEVWHYLTDNWIGSSPAVAHGRVFIGSEDGGLYCLNESTGELLWRFETGGAVYSSPLVVEGLILFGSHDGSLYCLDLEGKPLWIYSTWAPGAPVTPTLRIKERRRGGAIWSSPAFYGGLIYFGCEDGLVYCLNLSSGLELWSSETSGPIWSTPAVSDGIVYIGSKDGFLYAFDAFDGRPLWSFQTNASVYSSPAVYERRLVFGSLDGHIYCLSALNGSLLWSFKTDGPVYSSPAITESRVYIGSDGGSLYCLSIDDGSLIWRLRLGAPISSSPALLNDNLYVAAYDGYLYAVGSNRLKRRFPYYLTLHSILGNVYGAGRYEPGSVAVFYVEPMVVEAEPGVRYVFAQWISNRIGSGYTGSNATVRIIMDSAISETVAWKRQCYVELVADPPEGGVITPQSGWYDSGTWIEVSARARPGYRFKGFIGEGEGSYTGPERRFTLLVLNPVVERAVFERIPLWRRLLPWLTPLALLPPCLWLWRRRLGLSRR